MTLTGKYQLVESENFDEYMKELGVGFLLRKMGSAATPVTEISQSGEDWSIKTSTTFKTTEINFQMGKEFDEETADGRHCKSVITKDGDNKLIHVQECENSKFKKLQILREFNDDQMKMILELPGLTCTRVYKKI